MNVILLDRAVREIHDRGFTSFPCDDARSELSIIIAGFEALLGLPGARAAFTIPPKHWTKDELGEPLELGLIEKKGGEKGEEGFFDAVSGRAYDDPDKTFLHYAPKLLQHLPSSTRIEFSGFLAALERLNREALVIVRAIVEEFESSHRRWRERYPLPMTPRMERAVAITRVIRYGTKVGEVPNAQVHRDRDAFSVHRYASRPGLILFGKNGTAHRVSETDPASVAVFTGEKFPAMTGNAFGLGVPHGVRDEAAASGTSVKPRFTVVTFVHLPLHPSEVRWFPEHRALLRIDRSCFRL